MATQETGLYTVVLPFLLVFAIVYGLLSKLDLFGDKSQQVNGVVALALGLYAASNPALAAFSFEGFSGSVGLLLVFALTAMVGAALVGFKPNPESRVTQGLGVALALAIFGLAVAWGATDAVMPGVNLAVTVPSVGVDAMTASVLFAGIVGVGYMMRSGNR